MKDMKNGMKKDAGSTPSADQLGLYKQEKIGGVGGAQGNDGPSGNQVPVRKPEKLAKGFTVK